MIRVLIADDHPVVRHGIRQIVSAAGDITVVGEVADGREVLAQVRATLPDVVVLDLSMPEVDGFDILKDLKQDQPNLPVLILTMHSEDQFAIRALKAGASGYVTKDSAASELVDAIHKVVAGGLFITDTLAARITRSLGQPSATLPHDRLSDREYQVLRLLAAGRSTREISVRLSLSVKTIGTYRSRLYQKMGMRTPAELATYVARHRLNE